MYDKQSRVLVLQRDDDAEFWQSVTGTIELGEQPMQTAVREVLEETGIDINASGLALMDCRQINQFEIRTRWLHRYPPGTKYNTEYVFAVMCQGNESIRLTEHLQYLWLPKADAIEKVWSETNKNAIAAFVPDIPSAKGKD